MEQVWKLGYTYIWVKQCGLLAEAGVWSFCIMKVFNHTYHPGLAENIAPDGGPGSDIIAVRL